MKGQSEEKALAEASAVKLEKVKAGKLDKKDCRVLARVSCLSEVDSKGRLRKRGARWICLCRGGKPEEKGLN